MALGPRTVASGRRETPGYAGKVALDARAGVRGSCDAARHIVGG
ncbi:hypothetical protein [Kibdelosporangium philippinense]